MAELVAERTQCREGEETALRQAELLVDRRRFLSILGASLALGTLPTCAPPPDTNAEEKHEDRKSPFEVFKISLFKSCCALVVIVDKTKLKTIKRNTLHILHLLSINFNFLFTLSHCVSIVLNILTAIKIIL